jgi:hypothetical protein
VINVDPWWNKELEQQAFCRVFRFGQTKETSFTKLVVLNSIDEALEEIKARKEREIAGVMNDPKVTGRGSIAELMALLGEVRHDERGKPFIVSGADVNTTSNRYTGNPKVRALNEDGFLENEP